MADKPNAKPPNIVFILVDDQGWTDLSSQTDSSIRESKSDYYETPNIDALAAHSVRFTAGYAPSPICTPSRASIFTGKSPQQLGFTDIPESRPGSRRFSDLYTGKKLIAPQPQMGMPHAEITYAEFIRERVDTDYALAHFGKWHVGGGGPGQHGFEIHDGSTGNHNVNAHSDDPNPKDVFGITGRAISFIRAQVYSNRPFVIQLSHYANHVPFTAMQDTIKKYREKEKGKKHFNPVYAALNEDLDTSIGRLMAALDELEIGDNTFIVYMSDNGGSKNKKNPSTSNKPLREGKTWVYEGGIRVPFMIAGPGIEPGERSTPVIGWDLFPTFCDILDCAGGMPVGVEGGSLLPLLKDPEASVQRPRGDALVWHFPHYLTAKGTTPQSAIRVGDHKLIKFFHHDKSVLYDLSKDIGETTDVSDRLPSVAAALAQRLDDYLIEIDAGMPVQNIIDPPVNDVRSGPNPNNNVPLLGKHKSVFSRISYRIPKGWVVIDGETDWLAPSDNKHFWQPDFDPVADSYYAISAQPPYLTLEDRENQYFRSLSEIVHATLHSLRVASGATLVGEPESLTLNGNPAIRFLVQLDPTRYHYQVFVAIAEDSVATVAGNGPHSNRDELRDIVTAIAMTIDK